MIDGCPRLSELLIDITQCPNLDKARSDPSHACADVVGSQKDEAEFQVPEPWSGYIDATPIAKCL